MLNLSKDNKYVLACSYGPDSMALFDMLINEGFKFVVAHVNYHKREASNFEEESLRKYCAKNNIEIEVLDTANLKCDKNFQEWAREIRYEFFKKVANEYNASAVLVAHQQDDMIETYLMQKNRGGVVKYSGITVETSIFGVNIIRPLLGYSKQELLDYDKKNSVPYSIDISNLSNDYTRNKIRHEIVEKLSKKEREQLLDEIASKNNKEIKLSDCWKLTEFLELDNRTIIESISSYLNIHNCHKDLSSSFINETLSAFKSKKNHVAIKLIGCICLVKDYDFVYLDDGNFVTYRYSLEKGEKINDDLFEIDLVSGDRNISDNDYPLIVKPVDKNDVIDVKDYSCEVRRLFIDWKLPHYFRKSWPGIYNNEGKLIYVPRYRENFVDNHKSKFVIKFVKAYSK